MRMRTELGWPWTALVGEGEVDTPSGRVLGPALLTGVALSGPSSRNLRGHFDAVPRRRLPIRPAWPLIADVLFWAFVAWLVADSVFWGLAAVGVASRVAWRRGVRRARRSRCRKCGYELGGPTTCPECGTVKAQPRGIGE
jgi:hypothetical protein